MVSAGLQWRRHRARFLGWHEYRTPRALLRNVASSGWGEEGFTHTLRTRVADWILWKLAVGEAIFRCVFGRSDDTSSCDWWLKVGHRLKAIVCLLAGWHWKESESEWFFRDSFEITAWGWRKVSYEYDEWDNDRLEVGYGWRNWRVQLTVHEL
jgi:hypothetical protein